MLRPVTENVELSPKSSGRLNKLQEEVNKKTASTNEKGEVITAFVNQVKAASKKWDSKSSSDIGKSTFEEVKQKMEELFGMQRVCHYCEHNEPSDIEHIYPKSLYPRRAFLWKNYLFACKKCNTDCKSDRFAVWTTQNQRFNLPRNQEPVEGQNLLIDPRTENPEDFLIINLNTFEFEIIPSAGTFEFEKASYTVDLLKLNQRDLLIQARKNFYNHCYDSLERLCRIREAATTEELRQILRPNDDVEFDLPLAQLKEDITETYRMSILSHAHRSVWRAIQLQSISYPKWDALFTRLPEALHW